MRLTFKDKEVQILAHELAKLTGENITEAVTSALRERLDRVQAQREPALGEAPDRNRQRLNRTSAGAVSIFGARRSSLR